MTSGELTDRSSHFCAKFNQGSVQAEADHVMSKFWPKIGFGFFAVSAVLVGLLSLPRISYGQALLKEQIVGTWRLVSLYVEENGAKRYSFGENPLGLLMFDRSGNVMHILSKPGLPKFATNNRLTGTDAENRAVIQGMVAGFGTYTVDSNDTLTISWVSSSFPNRVGTQEKRKLKMSGDSMVYTDPVASSGGIAYSSYTRAK